MKKTIKNSLSKRKNTKRKNNKRKNRGGSGTEYSNNNSVITVRKKPIQNAKEIITTGIKNIGVALHRFGQFTIFETPARAVTVGFGLVGVGLCLSLIGIPLGLLLVSGSYEIWDTINHMEYAKFSNPKNMDQKTTIRKFFQSLEQLDEAKTREKLANLPKEEVELLNQEFKRIVDYSSKYNSNLSDFKLENAIDNCIVFINFIKQHNKGYEVGINFDNDGKLKLSLGGAVETLRAVNRFKFFKSEEYNNNKQQKENIINYFNDPKNEDFFLKILTSKIKDEQFNKKHDIPMYLANPNTGLSDIAIMMILHHKLNSPTTYDRKKTFKNLFNQQYKSGF